MPDGDGGDQVGLFPDMEGVPMRISYVARRKACLETLLYEAEELEAEAQQMLEDRTGGSVPSVVSEKMNMASRMREVRRYLRVQYPDG